MSETLVAAYPDQQSTGLAAEAEEVLALNAIYNLPPARPVSVEEGWADRLEPPPVSDEAIAASRERTKKYTFSHSTRIFDRMIEMEEQGLENTPEYAALDAYGKTCWQSSIIEMLQTDPEFRDPEKRVLEITRHATFDIVDDVIVAPDGTPIEEMALDGEQSALMEMEATGDERMMTPAIRAGSDRLIGHVLHQLKPNQCLFSWTSFPFEDMAKYGVDFFNSLGFREWLSFGQGYARTPENKLEAAYYSVDYIHPDLIREDLAGQGRLIPKGESTNRYLRYYIIFDGSPEDLRAYMEDRRTDLYAMAGITVPRYSMDQLFEENDPVCDQLYGVYKDIKRAKKTGRLTEFSQPFVDGLLEHPEYMHPGLHAQLLDMQIKDRLDEADFERLEELDRYATVEHLRDALPFLGTDRPARVDLIIAPGGVSQPLFMGRTLAGKVHNGLKAQRSYGGCTRSSQLFNEGGADEDDDPDAADIDDDERLRRIKKKREAGEDLQGCDYKIKTCYCCPYDFTGRPRDEPMEVTVRRYRNGIACCLRPGCGAALGPTGKVLSKGEIHAAAEERKARAGAAALATGAAAAAKSSFVRAA